MSRLRRVNRPADSFTMISNEFVRDSRLSFKARGLGAWLLSHIEGWETSIEAISRTAGVGREQVRTGLLELEAAGYLRRYQERDDHGRAGEAVYLIQCTPFDPEPTGQDRNRFSRPRSPRPRSPQPHKKTSSKNNIPKEKTPSGGSPAGESHPTGSTERPGTMTKTKTRQEPLALPLELPKPPSREPEAATARTVVAAFVDAYRAAHSGGNPTKANIGRVARDARRILDAGTAGPAELSAAATAMGASPWSNLGVALNIHRSRAAGKHITQGPAPVADRDAFAEGAAAEHAAFVEQIRNDPEVAAWVAEDPDAVARLVAEDPSLRAVFESATAA